MSLGDRRADVAEKTTVGSNGRNLLPTADGKKKQKTGETTVRTELCNWKSAAFRLRLILHFCLFFFLCCSHGLITERANRGLRGPKRSRRGGLYEVKGQCLLSESQGDVQNNPGENTTKEKQRNQRVWGPYIGGVGAGALPLSARGPVSYDLSKASSNVFQQAH